MTYYLVVAGEHRSGCIYLCCIKVITYYSGELVNIGQGAYICAASKSDDLLSNIGHWLYL